MRPILIYYYHDIFVRKFLSTGHLYNYLKHLLMEYGNDPEFRFEIFFGRRYTEVEKLFLDSILKVDDLEE